MNKVEINRSISKEEELRAVQAISSEVDREGTRVGKYLKKRFHHRAEPWALFGKKYDEIGYGDDHNNMMYIIYKDDNGRLAYRFSYYGSGMTRGGKTLTEEVADNIHISKKEEQRALQYLRGIECYAVDKGRRIYHMKTLRKYKHIVSDTPLKSDTVAFVADIEFSDGSKHQIFYGIRKNEHGQLIWGQLQVWEPGWPFNGVAEVMFKEQINEIKKPTANLHISKIEEDQLLQKIRQLSYDPYFTKTLRKIGHKKSTNPHISDVIDYLGEYSDGTRIIVSLRKDQGGNPCYYLLNAENMEKQSVNPIPIDESIFPTGIHISKEEEARAFQYLKSRKDNHGEPIGRHLKKLHHEKSTEPDVSDKIVYLNMDDGYTYIIKKNKMGSLIYGLGFIHQDGEYESFHFDPVPLQENAPTGDWRSWGMFTKSDKELLKPILQEYQFYLRKYTVSNIAEPRVYLIQKCIDNFDTTDPRFAAKPLAQLGMEERLALGDYVDHKDTTGRASSLFDFLLAVSRNYIEPPRPPKPDIFLKGITRVESPTMNWAGDASITGMEDMRPVINFGYGPYTLDSEFIDKFSKPGSKLWLDMGQKVIVVNMSEVMEKVKKAVEDYNKKNLTEGLEHPVLTKQDEQKVIQFIKNRMVDGERVGKTLKKIKLLPPRKDSLGVKTSNVFHYQSTIKNKVYDYYFWRVDIGAGFIVLIGEGPNDYYEYHELTESKKRYLVENLERAILTKQDEARAVQIISNFITEGGVRLGKTLKKVKVIPTNNPNVSDTAVYDAILPDGSIMPFEIFRSLRRGLVIVDQVNFIKYFPDKYIDMASY